MIPSNESRITWVRWVSILWFVYRAIKLELSSSKLCFWNPRKWIRYLQRTENITFRQWDAYQVSKQFLSLCEKNDIKLYAIHGTLLGGVRSHAFAGRPKDHDFAIRVADLDRLFAGIHKNSHFDLCAVKVNKGVLHIVAKYGCMVSVTVLEEERNVYTPSYKFDLNSLLDGLHLGTPFLDFRFPKIHETKTSVLTYRYELGTDTISIYDVEIPIPTNYIALLERQYGLDWRLKKGRQHG